MEGNEVTLHRPNDSKEMKTIHGTTRAPFEQHGYWCIRRIQRKNLKCAGLDTVHNFKDQNLFWLLVNHTQTKLKLQKELLLNFQTQQQSLLAGISKEVVGQTAAYVRSLRSPEPYKGKGIRYVGEYVRSQRR